MAETRHHFHAHDYRARSRCRRHVGAGHGRSRGGLASWSSSGGGRNWPPPATEPIFAFGLDPLPLVDLKVAVAFPLGDVAAELAPLGALGLDQALEDVVAEDLADDRDRADRRSERSDSSPPMTGRLPRERYAPVPASRRAIPY